MSYCQCLGYPGTIGPFGSLLSSQIHSLMRTHSNYTGTIDCSSRNGPQHVGGFAQKLPPFSPWCAGSGYTAESQYRHRGITADESVPTRFWQKIERLHVSYCQCLGYPGTIGPFGSLLSSQIHSLMRTHSNYTGTIDCSSRKGPQHVGGFAQKLPPFSH